MIYGADFSTLPALEAAGAAFYDGGKRVDLVECLAGNGISSARLRLWLDPYDESGRPYGGGSCSTERMLGLARRASAAGMGIMLDFHYSDFWCDPGRQCIPKAWRGMDRRTMVSALREYTLRTLDAFDRAGVSPESAQVGNEITNGMLWPEARLDPKLPGRGFDALAEILAAGCEAVRQGSDASVMLHLERSGNRALWQDWLDEICALGVSFDELGASYYPYWHGSLSEMADNLAFCCERYGKTVRIVETSYAYTQKPKPKAGAGVCPVMNRAGNLRDDGGPMPYPATPEGQLEYIAGVKKAVSGIDTITGLYWWEPAWIPVEGEGWATEASLKYCGEEGKPTGNEWVSQCLFDCDGNALPALYEFAK